MCNNIIMTFCETAEEREEIGPTGFLLLCVSFNIYSAAVEGEYVKGCLLLIAPSPGTEMVFYDQNPEPGEESLWYKQEITFIKKRLSVHQVNPKEGFINT